MKETNIQPQLITPDPPFVIPSSKPVVKPVPVVCEGQRPLRNSELI